MLRGLPSINNSQDAEVFFFFLTYMVIALVFIIYETLDKQLVEE